jgi:formate dehydrogenase maturation protein FdhE
VPTSIESIIGKLEEQEKAEGTLPALLKFYKAILEIQARVGRSIVTPNPVFTREVARAHAQAGKPLASFTELAIDWTLARKTFTQVVALFSSYPELFGTLPDFFHSLTPGRIINQRTARAWYRDRQIVLPAPVDDAAQIILKAIFHTVLKPFLTGQAQELVKLVDQENWRCAYCPICGGNPDFSYLTKETGARWLVCSRCDTEWLFQRIQCPCCGNTDQNQLSFFTDDTGLYRLYVCEKCKHYLKAIDQRHVTGDMLVPLERLLTWDMDRQAQEKGYTPCD